MSYASDHESAAGNRKKYSVRLSGCSPPALFVVPDRESFSRRTESPPETTATGPSIGIRPE